MPELIVAPLSRNSICSHILAVLLCAIMPMSYLVTVQEKGQRPAVRSSFNPNPKIDPKRACDFVSFWASDAFAYDVEDPMTGPQAAEPWTSNQCLIDRLKKTIWTKDLRTRPSRCRVISVGNPCVLDDKNVAVDLDAVFSWDSIGLKYVPMRLHLIVQKQSEGYRIDSITIDYYKQLKLKGYLFISGHTMQMHCLVGKNYPIVKNYRVAVENLKPNLAEKHSFDAVFFSWVKAMNSVP